MIWTVDRETALLIGAGRALLLQLGHPLIAAGVAEHSRFAEDPFDRLFRTLETSYALVFGDMDAAMSAVRRMDAVHRRVRGVLRERAGSWAPGTPYDAMDPALRLWVHATLVDTSLLVYHRFVASLSGVDQARYYADSRELARLVGIPEALIPATMTEFRTYVAAILSSEIAAGATARSLARRIFSPPRVWSFRLLGPLARFLTVGLLPPRVREQYGYRWNATCEGVLEAMASATKRLLPAIPAVIRVAPHARAAERQLRLLGRARQTA